MCVDRFCCHTVHWRAFGPFWHAFGIPWLCYLAWWAETLAKQTNSLPISARLKQPSLMQRGQKRRQKGPKARQSTVHAGACKKFVPFFWTHIISWQSMPRLWHFCKKTKVVLFQPPINANNYLIRCKLFCWNSSLCIGLQFCLSKPLGKMNRTCLNK